MRVCEYTLKPAALTQHRNTRTCPRTLSACVEQCSAGGTWFLALAGMPCKFDFASYSHWSYSHWRKKTKAKGHAGLLSGSGLCTCMSWHLMIIHY